MINVQQIILNSAIVRFLSQKSKKIILPGFEGVPLYDVIKFFLTQIRKIGLNDRARSIAFSFLTAVPAAAIFICTLIPYLPVSKKITHQLMQLTKDITPNQNTSALVSNFLNDFFGKAPQRIIIIRSFAGIVLRFQCDDGPNAFI